MSDAMPTCGQCRYFRTEAPSPPVDPSAGRCRRRSPGAMGWPGTTASDWCGDWDMQVPANTGLPMDLVLSRIESMVERLQELDERVTAMELSVTAAHMEFRGMDA